MSWGKLRVVPFSKRREDVLQDAFDGWGDGNRCVAGAPAWLMALGAPEHREGFPACGYSFRPDVLWRTPKDVWVAELKCSYKYEPLALAEVLHHAFLLNRCETRPVIPLLITSYSPWLRAAVRHLGPGAANLRVLEVDVISAGRYLWFDAPHAKWHPARQVPNHIPRAYRSWTWFKSSECGTYFAVQEQHASSYAHGPPWVIDVPYVMFAPVVRGNKRTREWLLWQGIPPASGQPRRRSTWKVSEYWRYQPGSEEGVEPNPVV